MAKIDASMILALIDMVRGFLGKKPKAKLAGEVLGKDLKLYLDTAAKFELAAEHGNGLMLSPAEVAILAKADDLMVKAATKAAKVLPKQQ